MPTALQQPYAMEADIRLEDYLDDRLQSSSDLDNLDALLANVEEQRSQLQSQLDKATRELEQARRSASGRQDDLARQMDEFQKLQHSIDARLRVVAASDAPDEAIRRLETPMRQLHRVALARDYLALLRDVGRLRAEARAHLPQSPKAALRPYTALKQLSARLRELQARADGAAVHLVDHVAAVTNALWAEMKETMWRELELVLDRRRWPGDVDPHARVDDEWRGCFEKLMDLQVPEVLYSDRAVVALLPIDVMAQIFVKEFRFHFMSDKATSNPQTIGTHCFPWFLNRVERWEDFLRDNFGYIVASKFKDTSASGKMVYMDPVCAFIAALLPVVREKVHSSVAEVVKNPAILSTLLSQLMTFDENLRSNYSYDGGDPDNGWRGLTSDVLDQHFTTWFEAEKEFALERFNGIMESKDARSIDYEYSGKGKTKPTYGAVRVMDLLRTVTAQYERLRSFSQKLKFLIYIQLTILDDFHDRLRGSLEAYYSMTSTVGRTLQGFTKEQLAALEGTGRFETLCKVYGSADHIVNTLKDWSNEEFFIALYDELQSRAKEKTDDQTDIGRDLDYDQVKERTSENVGTDDDGGIIFDETIAAYSARRASAQDFIVSALVDTHYKAFKAYLFRPHWSTISEDAAEVEWSELSITPELVDAEAVVKGNLEFLSQALGTAPFRRVWRQALERLQGTLWSDVLVRQNFTTLGAAQFRRDMHQITSLVERYIPNGSAPLAALLDGIKLLGLPTAPSDGAVSLQRASDMVFTDNAEAKKLLEDLGIDTLTPANARAILQRRVENKD